jgi:hypothetical protein
LLLGERSRLTLSSKLNTAVTHNTSNFTLGLKTLIADDVMEEKIAYSCHPLQLIIKNSLDVYNFFLSLFFFTLIRLIIVIFHGKYFIWINFISEGQLSIIYKKNVEFGGNIHFS